MSFVLHPIIKTIGASTCMSHPVLNCLQISMALKEEQTSSSEVEEESGGEGEENSDVDESDQGDDGSGEDEEENVSIPAITACEKKVEDGSKSEKLDKTGLNEFLVKLRRPITQAKVTNTKSFEQC